MTSRNFAWQAWHLVISTFVLCGRHGAISHPPSFCVASMVLMALGGALGSVLVAGDTAILSMAGMAHGDIYIRFMYRWGTISYLPWFCLAGRRGTHGTGWSLGPVFVADDAAVFFVAGVTQENIYLRFTWQAYHHLILSLLLYDRHVTISIHYPPCYLPLVSAGSVEYEAKDVTLFW